jgi:hypothetical protein
MRKRIAFAAALMQVVASAEYPLVPRFRNRCNPDSRAYEYEERG